MGAQPEPYSDKELIGEGLTSQRARDRLVASLANKGVQDKRVLDIMRRLPRHLFIDPAFAARAYEDVALPIGQRQTISQPWVVAVMTEALVRDRAGDQPLDRVLEIGTGSGYQSAVLASLAHSILSYERIAKLHQQAQLRLSRLGLVNVYLKLADGGEQKPSGTFDAVICAAATQAIPSGWTDCLAAGGRLVAPVGRTDSDQRLVLVERQKDGSLRESDLGAVAFVPLREGVQG